MKTILLAITLAGVLADYITTRIGLSMGFYETHQNYNPIIAAVIFTTVALALASISIKGKAWKLSVYTIVSAPFLGAVNNILVILGLFSGLVI